MLISLLALALGLPAQPLPKFSAPIALTSGGEQIWAEGGGMTPAWIDGNGDGKKDLVVSPFGCGEIRFYTNMGRAPEFGAEAFLPCGGKERWVSICDQRLSMDFADVNADGRLDAVVGMSNATVMMYLGTSSGFATGVKVFNPRPTGRKPIPSPAPWREATVSITDWDDDNRPDIVMGVQDGRILWMKNSGSRTSPAFDLPRPVRMASGGLEFPRGSEPQAIATDWNDDGQTDLVIATRDGSLFLAPGTRTAEVGKPVPLPGLPKLSLGYWVRIALADVDGNGKRDIIASGTIDFPQSRRGYMSFLRGL